MHGARRGLSVSRTSYYRTLQKNRLEGGKPASQHLLGLAMDFVGQDLDRLAERAVSQGFVALKERDHLHIQAYPAGKIPATWYDLALGIGWRPPAS